MEHITEGILEMLRISGTIAGDDELERIKEMQRTNPSSRRKDFSFYYDEETVELIQKRDRLIAEGYGYSPPEIS